MTEAGFSPMGAVNMFEHMAAASPGKRNFFENLLATHPETQERIANAKGQVGQYSADIQSRDLGEAHYAQLKARLP
jgi:predicted Zn-dependent protease